MAKDAITMLREDHKTVEQLFKRFEKAGDRATKTKRELVDRMIKELSVHAGLEEQIFYPAAREALDEDDTVLEGIEEHHVVKWTLSELEGMDPEHERFEAKVTVLMDMVRHHVEEEEKDMFPAIRSALGRKRLQEIGDAMQQAKPMMATRPHPRLPDEPPGNVIAGLGAAATDKVIDLTRGAVEKVTRRR